MMPQRELYVFFSVSEQDWHCVPWHPEEQPGTRATRQLLPSQVASGTVPHSEVVLGHGVGVATQAADCPLVGAGEFDVHRAVPVKCQRDTRSSLHHRSLATAEHHQLTVQAQGQGHKLSIQLRQKRKENYMGAYRFNIFPLFTNPE